MRALIVRAALALVTLAGCTASEPAYSLGVSLRTDAVPGVEFHTVLTELFVDDGVVPRVVASAERRVYAGERFDEIPGEVARLLPQPAGLYRVRVTLLSRDGTRPTLRRSAETTLPGEGLTLTIDRACLEVSCPDAAGGGDECVGGTCTDPLCAANPVDCGLPSACGSDADCPTPDLCAEATCFEGVCLAVAVPDACPGESYCHPTLGCVPYEEPDRCGSPCTDPADRCGVGYLRCSPGELPTCVPFLRRPAGTPCDGGMCDGAGGCMPCESGAPCRRGCDAGTVTCNEDGSGECMLDGSLTPEGERCHPDDFCVEGSECTFVGSCDSEGICVLDPDPGARVTPVRDLATTENGTADRFDVVLLAAPSAAVSVAMVATPEREVALEPESLEFDADNWNTPQSVVVTGLNDMVVDGDQPFAIAFTFTSEDDGYDALALEDKLGLNVDFEEGACVLPDGECDANPGTVCETRLDTATDCGACGMACPESLPGATGMCVHEPGFTPDCEATCDPGFDDCNGDVMDGCEVDTDNSRTDCGMCGRVCPIRPNADTTCEVGACGYTCQPGFADCNGIAGDGCEVDLMTDVMACGDCGTTCPEPPGTMATCSGGTCGTECSGGLLDCDGMMATGCETDPATDPQHCGRCGMVCASGAASTPTCTGGLCGIDCDPGFEDCNGMPGDGCEADLTSTASCGGCAPCDEPPNATATCASMSCGFDCSSPFADCDGDAMNGCEANTFSTMTCGPSCTRCSPPPFATASCDGTSCDFECVANRGNCDGMAANGCEAELLSDAMHCGRCGNDCMGEACVDGRCAAGCADPGEACDGETRCCDGKACTGGFCPTACADPGGTCGDGVVCCDGMECIDGRCPGSTCGGDGSLCEVPSDCCDGLGCAGGRCTARCIGDGGECGDAGFPCCNPGSCDLMRGVCVGAACGEVDDFCEGDGDCCDGLTCRSGRCARLPG